MRPSSLFSGYFIRKEDTMKKILVIGAALFLIIGMCAFAGGGKAASGGGAQQETVKEIRVATGGTAGTYYPYGTAIGQIWQEQVKIPVTIQSTGASRANLQLIDAGEIEVAMVQNDTADYGFKGIDMFAAEGAIKTFTAMASLYPEQCQIVARANAGIRTIADLKGKRVSVGDVGSGTEICALQILESYGIGPNDIQKQNLGFGASAEAIKNGQLDAAFNVAGAPTAAIVDLALTNDIIILEVDTAGANKLKQKYPFYATVSIPANTYKGQNAAVQVVAIKAIFVVANTMPENVVYDLTKILIEKQPQIAAAHAKGKELSRASIADGISIPFHPGAAKYLKEIGAIK